MILYRPDDDCEMVQVWPTAPLYARCSTFALPVAPLTTPRHLPLFMLQANRLPKYAASWKGKFGLEPQPMPLSGPTSQMPTWRPELFTWASSAAESFSWQSVSQLPVSISGATPRAPWNVYGLLYWSY